MPIVRLIPNALIASAGWNAEGPVTVAKLSTDDGGTTAVYSPTSGNYMRFTVDASAIPDGATINSATFGASVSKLDPVDALTRNTFTIAGNTYEAGNFSPSATNTYQYSTWITPNNYANGQLWTKADMQSVQVGIKKENGAGQRCSFLYIDVDYTGGGTSASGQIKVWDGSAWVAKPVKVWTGSAWVTKPLKRWNGTTWEVTPY